MTTAAKPMTAIKTRTDWNQFAKFTIAKLTENIYDMLITIITLGLLFSYLMITVPEVTVAYGAYIIIFYLLMLARRIAQDFDENWTLDELGERLIELDEKITTLDRVVRIEMNDDEIQHRMEA